MATTELPEWENSKPQKKSIFSRANLLSNTNGTKSLWGTKKSSFSSEAPLPMTAENPENPEKNAVDIPHSEEVRVEPGTRRRYCGHSRNFCICLFVLILCLLALIIGLSVGLKGKGHKSSIPADLPLPTNTGIFTGDITYYSPGPGFGACGFQNTSTEAICAVSHILWDAASVSANPNNNPLCGQMIRITRFNATTGGNQSVDVEVVDRCVGCAAVDLDLSLKMFTSLADESLGRTLASWAWLN